MFSSVVLSACARRQNLHKDNEDSEWDCRRAGVPALQYMMFSAWCVSGMFHVDVVVQCYFACGGIIHMQTYVCACIGTRIHRRAACFIDLCMCVRMVALHCIASQVEKEVAFNAAAKDAPLKTATAIGDSLLLPKQPCSSRRGRP